jgi:cytochrome c oxidase assembly protein subunit 15
MRRVQLPTIQSRQSRSALALVALVLLQIYLGALVAGLDAGLTYNTWPLIDGAFIPAADRLWFETPLWRNLFENILTVQFNHRMAAYLLVMLAALHVLTLIEQVPMSLGILHQFMAVVVLTVAVVHAERLTSGAPASLHRRPDKAERTRA